ncbi:unnamed protein product [Psylliodes chrysocephalus]|uniref:C-type lectin domain-containing protein n=1 Tax=Psylliodes chrysocephalus TaxID=3402493 RepID=A0A9P0CPQ3_9CUCU|nr:unnamed protein product [Psylliodes chrysocephala]
MAVLLQSLVVLSICAVLNAAACNNVEQTNNNCVADSWEQIFRSPSRSSILPLLRYKNKLYYMGVHFRANWYEALHFCESIHMKLLSIHSADENQIISKYVKAANKGTTEFWTGGTRLVDGTNFVWMPYGTRVEYTNWSGGQPSDVNEKCLQLWGSSDNLTWNDRDCNLGLFFICERCCESNTCPPGL